MDALGAEMVLGHEARGIVERGDGEVHIVAAFQELEAERGAAFPAKRPPRDRRAVVPIGLRLPADVRGFEFLNAMEIDPVARWHIRQWHR